VPDGPKLRVIPLGGLGEIGKNMMLIEYGDDMIAIDAGLMFPEEEMLGVDLVIPDVSYIEQHRHKFKGIFITHGHEDHTGGLPYVLRRVRAPVYATPLSHGLISVKLKEHHLLETTDLRTILPGESLSVGAFRIQPFQVAHSIPDAVGFAIRTPMGTVVHTGDFKLDHTPVMGQQTDLAKLAELGREGGMMDNVQMARERGYLNFPRELSMGVNDLRGAPAHEVAIVTTGSQGEPTSALTRMANGDHQHVQIQPGDTVVLSASPIPGNEALVYRTVDNLFRLGARVLYNRTDNIHVRGHAAQEELKIVQALVKPKYFVPIHGEYRHLVLHARLAREMGIEEDNAIVLIDGDVLELDEGGAEVREHIPADYVYVDGIGVGDVDQFVLRDRQHLASDGMVVVILAVDKQTGRVIGKPDVVSRGVTSIEESSELLEGTRSAVVEALEGADHLVEWSLVNQTVREAVGRFLYAETHRRPMVLPVAVEV
jgi:ribonuclease J